jgi:hypothetical protein
MGTPRRKIRVIVELTILEGEYKEDDFRWDIQRKLSGFNVGRFASLGLRVNVPVVKSFSKFFASKKEKVNV